MHRIKAFLASCILALSFTQGELALAAPETGWYWNPAESGRGFFVQRDGDITFIGAYFYDNDGRANWLVAGGPDKDPYNFTGQLLP